MFGFIHLADASLQSKFPARDQQTRAHISGPRGPNPWLRLCFGHVSRARPCSDSMQIRFVSSNQIFRPRRYLQLIRSASSAQAGLANLSAGVCSGSDAGVEFINSITILTLWLEQCASLGLHHSEDEAVVCRVTNIAEDTQTCKTDLYSRSDLPNLVLIWLAKISDCKRPYKLQTCLPAHFFWFCTQSQRPWAASHRLTYHIMHSTWSL